VLGIPEYWIVDLLERKVTVCTLVEGFYDTQEFVNADVVRSQTFNQLQLTAEQIVNS
jgi:Uma2 family endonuclease